LRLPLGIEAIIAQEAIFRLGVFSFDFEGK
jgi:hypothetical protein